MALLALLAIAPSAQAAFPGTNGRIVFTAVDWDYEVRDVWSMNPDGSGSLNLTNHPAQDFAPAFSPDGSRIAFTSDRDGDEEIYVMNADGSDQRRLTTAAGRDSNPAFSADGDLVAFTSERDGNKELYVMRLDGGAQTRLTATAADEDGAAFSADGSLLAFTSDADGDQEIHVMASDGSNPRRLTDNAARDVEPSFSPDSSAIAFTSDRDGSPQVWTMRRDGSGQAPVTSVAGGRSHFEPGFSPDGTRMVATSAWHCGMNYCGQTYSGALGVANADGSGEALITDDGGVASQADWGVAAPGTPPPPAPDTTAPETTITVGPSGATSDTTPSFGFAGSDAMTAPDQLRYSFAVDSGAWSPFSTETGVTLGGASGLSEGAHTFAVRARDSAGNLDPTPATRSFFVDSVAPNGSVLINGGATRVRSQSVTLTLSARDQAPASGVTGMRFANTAAGLSSAAWRAYATTVSWTLTAGAGTKTVHVQYRDGAGNVSSGTQATTTYKP